MPATIEEIEQYVTSKLANESTEELTLIRDATERQLPECQEEHKIVLDTWVSTIDRLLQDHIS